MMNLKQTSVNHRFITYRSDGITMFQQIKIITGLYHISYPYLRRSTLVKSEPDHLDYRGGWYWWSTSRFLKS